MLVFSVLSLLLLLLLRGAASQCVSHCGCSASPDTCCLTVRENQPPGQIGVDDSAATSARLANYSQPRFLFAGHDTNPDSNSTVFGMFQINPLDATVFTLRSLDRELLGKDSCIELPVAVREESGMGVFLLPIFLKVLDVNDNAPVFSAPFFVISIPETHVEASGQVSRVQCTPEMVRMLTATDADEGDNAIVTYSVEGDQSSLFVVDDPSVPCVVNAPGVDLDRDLPPSDYSFTLVATSRSGDSVLETKVLVIYDLTDVNDNLPFFPTEGYSISVREDHELESEIFQFKAEDPDQDSEFCYSIIGDGTFIVNEYTGSLILANSLDAETSSMVYLVVTVRSKGTDLTYDYASTIVHISIIDVNEMATIYFGVFTTPPVTQITENVVQTVIIDFMIEDGDKEPWNRDKNTLAVVGDSTHMFTMLEVPSPSQSVWLLQQVKPADFEKNKTIQVHIQSTEYGDPIVQQDLLYNLTILDVNDNRPYLSCNHFSILEDGEGISSNRQIVNLGQYVFDNDSSSNGITGSYYLLSVTTSTEDLSSHFARTLNESTGVVSTESLDISLDREVLGDTLVFRVLLTDMGDPPLFQEVKFNVTLLDVNDNPPVFELPHYTFNITENQPSSTHVGRVHTSDLDSDENSAVIYSIQEKAGSPFTIDELTGDLRSAAMFDRESRDTYQITVLARDGGNSSLTAESVAVTVTILDENDEIPFFIRYQEDVDLFAIDTSFTIDTSFSAGDEVGIVIATDNDEFPNNRILYALDPPSPIFNLQDSSVGIITLGQEITEEHVGSYQLNVSAFNPGQESIRDMIAVTVVINTASSFTLLSFSVIIGATCFLVVAIIIIALIACICYTSKHHERHYEVKVSPDKAQKMLEMPTSPDTQQPRSRVTFSDQVQETHYDIQGVVTDTRGVIRKESGTKFSDCSRDTGSVEDRKQSWGHGRTNRPGRRVNLDVVETNADVCHTSIPYRHPHCPHTPPHPPPLHMPAAQVVVTRRREEEEEGEEEVSSDSHTFVESEKRTLSEEASIVSTTVSHHYHHRHHRWIRDPQDIRRDTLFTRLHLYSHFPGMSRGKPAKSTLEQLHAHNLAQLTGCGQQQETQHSSLGTRDKHSRFPSQTSIPTQLPHLDSETTQSPHTCMSTPLPLGQASIPTQSQTVPDSEPRTPPPAQISRCASMQSTQTPNNYSSCEPTPPALDQISISTLSHSCVQTPSVLGQISVPTQSSQPHLQGPGTEGRMRVHRMPSIGMCSETSTELDGAMKFETDSEPEVISLSAMTTISEESPV